MKNQCPRCGQKLDKNAAFCPYCQYPVAYMRQQNARGRKTKKQKKHRFLKFLLILFIILGILAAAWYIGGNYVTLYFHSEEVLDTVNGGSLDLPGMETSDSSELPGYVRDMLGESVQNEKEGPILRAVKPYVRIQRVAINGLLSNASVEYRITAPDMVSWFRELDPESITSSEQLLEELLAYIPQAPARSQTVVIEYYRDGWFNWLGNYQTPEWADAVCGGLNTAYNEFYQRMLEELEAMLE